ncbi:MULTISPECIES: manganese efflux pump MntP family protein [unclassified Clostridium]|uniref:manganese efflux pump MntP n=1 Tax=unclassified Clostridium TaxID=2614128 RepID=UPI0018992B73|nr:MULTISPECIES: manganese efflux pump MntP family protein [unclassified Clostridium]MCR1951662.1 manganese efflux pump MntP family protein [Clostridium sp. DSM 100503]
MGFFSIFMTGIGLSMDAFAVSLAKGICLKEDEFKYSLRVALFFGGFQALMPLLGWWFGRYFEDYIKSFDHWIAFILLGIIGGKMLIESIKEMRSEENDIALECERDEFSYKKLTILAIATSIDALAVGVSFAFLSVSIIPSITIIGITTFVLSFLAVFLGKKLGEHVQNYAEIIGGIILIGIGFKILFEHLM